MDMIDDDYRKDGLYREVCYEGSNEGELCDDTTGAFINISEIRNEHDTPTGAGMAGVSRVSGQLSETLDGG